MADCICWGFLRGYKTLYPLRRRGGEQRSARQGKAFPYFFISFLTKPPDFFIIDRNVSRNLYLIKLRISWKMNKGVHSICGIIFPNGVSAFFYARKILFLRCMVFLMIIWGLKNGESVFNSGGWNGF